MAPFGLRALERMLADGLPAALASPLRVLIGAAPPVHARAVRARVERLRAAIAGRPETYGFAHTSTPQGLARWPIAASALPGGPVVSARWLAHVASVPERWGVFLHLCAEAVSARTILELGACVGISGAYLASAGACRRFVTLEGSPPLARLAAATLGEVTDRAVVLDGPFDEGLNRAFALLTGEGLGLNLVYVDGHHDEAATLHYVRAVIPRLEPGALVILDDIYLSDAMWRAWRHVSVISGFSASANVGRFGLLIWEGGAAAPARFDLSRYTGWWRVGPSPRSDEALARLGS